MKKIAFIFITFTVFVLFLYIIKNYYNVSLRSIFRVSKKPQITVSDILKKGRQLEEPLKIEQGFHIGLFSDLKELGSPRVIAFDKYNLLFVTLTKAGKLIALPDRDMDGVADQEIVVLSGLTNPHGIEFYDKYLYLAESGKVTRFNYDSDNISLSEPTVLFTLPEGGRHFTRTIKILDQKLYTSVGSSCDVCIEGDEKRAVILVSNLDGSNLSVFASGLRNTVFFTFDKEGKIWGNEMGRDYLGNDLPPDELNIITLGDDYGWPRCYGKAVRDIKYRNWESLEYCKETKVPVFEYPAHVAPLGIAFIDEEFSKNYTGDILSAFHGSWNSSTPVGYKIVKLSIENGQVSEMSDFISGFVDNNGNVLGRPVDLVFNSGELYISDDKADAIYVVSSK